MTMYICSAGSLYTINYILNSKNLAIVKKFGDKTEFTIARFNCTRKRYSLLKLEKVEFLDRYHQNKPLCIVVVHRENPLLFFLCSVIIVITASTNLKSSHWIRAT